MSAAVIRAFRHSRTAWRPLALALTVLAVAFKIMVPQGFMARAATGELPFAIVLCTGTGPVTVTGDALTGHGGSDEAPAPGQHDSPCAFAGYAGGAPPPLLAAVEPAPLAAYRPPALAAPVGLAPGRGLAGPPLPARGPPSLLI